MSDSILRSHIEPWLNVLLNHHRIWLVVLPILKNISQWEGYPYIMEKQTCLNPPTRYPLKCPINQDNLTRPPSAHGRWPHVAPSRGSPALKGGEPWDLLYGFYMVS